MASQIDTPSEADYVIVGGGTSGLVLAARLSEGDAPALLSSWRPEKASSRILESKLLPSGPLSWDQKRIGNSSPRRKQTGFGDRVIKEPQGRLLGGSSGFNGQAFIAPTKAGIDGWAKLGATSWTWENIAPYYRKASTLQLPDEATRDHIGTSWVDPEVNGDSGPIKVSFPAVRQHPLSKAWVDTFREMGYGVTADPF